MKGKLFLIPTLLGSQSPDEVLPNKIKEIVKDIKVFIAEDIRTARSFLSKLRLNIDLDSVEFFEMSEHTPVEETKNIIQPLLDGKDAGLISEAGMPAIADPGQDLVRCAHESGVRVIPLSGPSSILLGLIASGMNGQQFCFNGYLPVKNPARINKIKELEKRSYTQKQTEIFMETPYRNMSLLNDILSSCRATTRLCIASNITLNDEFILTCTIEQWKKNLPDIHKKPVVFLLENL